MPLLECLARWNRSVDAWLDRRHPVVAFLGHLVGPPLLMLLGVWKGWELL